MNSTFSEELNLNPVAFIPYKWWSRLVAFRSWLKLRRPSAGGGNLSQRGKVFLFSQLHSEARKRESVYCHMLLYPLVLSKSAPSRGRFSWVLKELGFLFSTLNRKYIKCPDYKRFIQSEITEERSRYKYISWSGALFIIMFFFFALFFCCFTSVLE